MKRTAFAAIGFASAMVIAASAMAADPIPTIPTVSPAATAAASNVAAMVEVFGGFDFHKSGDPEDSKCEGCHSKGLGFGGEGRAAWMVTPTFSMQLNVWAEHWSGQAFFEGVDCDECDFDWATSRQGVGTHLTYNTGNLQAGGFLSLGARDPDLFAFNGPEGTYLNAGVEAAHNGGQFRLYGQVGHTMVIGPAWLREFFKDEDHRQFYGRVIGTFYPQPNIALSANAGVEVMNLFGDLWGRLLTWGARAEFQPSGTPIYVFGSYQGGYNTYDDEFEDITYLVNHVVRLGFGINIGSADIQSRDRAVGLADFNCTFGVMSTPGCLAWVPTLIIPF